MPEAVRHFRQHSRIGLCAALKAPDYGGTPRCEFDSRCCHHFQEGECSRQRLLGPSVEEVRARKETDGRRRDESSRVVNRTVANTTRYLQPERARG